MRFLIRIFRHGDDYSALVPDLPGCVAAGDSVEEVRELISKAVSWHLEMMIQAGEKVPEPNKRMEFVIDQEGEEEFCTWIEVEVPQVA